MLPVIDSISIMSLAFVVRVVTYIGPSYRKNEIEPTYDYSRSSIEKKRVSKDPIICLEKSAGTTILLTT